MKPVNAVVETPKGKNEKYDYEPVSGFFKLKKILPAGMVFPYDFGFIQDTKGEDGDPLDVVIISEFKSFTGCMISCRIIGCIQARQQESKNGSKKIRNDRFLAIPEASVAFEKIRSIKELSPKIIKELQKFFINYNKEEDKIFDVEGLLGPTGAAKLIEKNKTIIASN